MCVAKTKALISCMIATQTQLIWVFVFAYAISRCLHDAAHMVQLICSREMKKTDSIQ